MSNRKSNLLIIVVIMFCAVGCSLPDTSFDLGTISNNYYTNSTLGMRVKLPSTWHALSRKQLNEMARMSPRIEQPVDLFLVAQDPVASMAEFNPQIVARVEEVRNPPGAAPADAYIDATLDSFRRAQRQFTVVRESQPTTINGKAFSSIQLEIKMDWVTFKQDHYVTIEKGYVIVFINSYTNDSQKSILEGVIQSVRFDG